MRLSSPFSDPHDAPSGPKKHTRDSKDHSPKPDATPPQKPVMVSTAQYSLSTLLVIMVVASVAFAPAFYFVRAKDDATMQMPAILFTVASPLLLVVALRLGLSLQRWYFRR